MRTVAPAAFAFLSVSLRLATSYPVVSLPYGYGRCPSVTKTVNRPNREVIRIRRNVSEARPMSIAVALESSLKTLPWENSRKPRVNASARSGDTYTRFSGIVWSAGYDGEAVCQYNCMFTPPGH